MSKPKSNGDPRPPKAHTIQIVATETGQIQLNHPPDLTLTIQILARAMDSVGARMARESYQPQEQSKIQTAPASALRALPDGPKNRIP